MITPQQRTATAHGTNGSACCASAAATAERSRFPLRCDSTSLQRDFKYWQTSSDDAFRKANFGLESAVVVIAFSPSSKRLRATGVQLIQSPRACRSAMFRSQARQGHNRRQPI